ncbi:thiamine biosynthesis protein ThiS [Syntrophotalea acetylenivorans]|uniref:Thiamine biosynthesis protein ThiS n=1 Tax=Syntrophotalea acetylenivorans TaxID=1842532 RepID=A0A1L3GPS9_9BACT|nr:sulfur carrier protein ThiS [Syntrophotalea acetylenivorans]APG27890.1 thiamine biosynthesis protein ThiS [Syntrophotalea acetylenivorans]
MITLTVNGRPQSCSAANIHELLQELQLACSQVAVELNRNIVPRDNFEQTPLRDGDELEIVRFVGGG